MNKFIGIPFADAEPSYNGANCYGLVQLFYRDYLGINIPTLDTKSGHSSRVWATYLKQISEHWIAIEKPEVGDVVAMAHDLDHPKIVQHFGVYIGDGKVLHTLYKLNSHISTIQSLQSIIRGYYRWQH